MMHELPAEARGASSTQAPPATDSSTGSSEAGSSAGEREAFRYV